MTWQAIKKGASWITNGAAAIGDMTWQAIKKGASWITNGAAAIGTAVDNKIGGTLTSIKNFISDLPKNIANAVTNFASGGVVTGPTLATVGEAGPEAIIPLDRLEDMMSQQRGRDSQPQPVVIRGGLGSFVEEVERTTGVDL
jgi:hypothetical protein